MYVSHNTLIAKFGGLYTYRQELLYILLLKELQNKPSSICTWHWFCLILSLSISTKTGSGCLRILAGCGSTKHGRGKLQVLTESKQVGNECMWYLECGRSEYDNIKRLAQHGDIKGLMSQVNSYLH